MRTLIASSALAATLLLPGQAALAQNAPFCMRGSESGGLNCAYDTMAQCQQSLSGASYTGTCVENPRLRGTVGYGSGAGPTIGGSTGQGSPPAAPPRGYDRD
jgi:hypothetical protein